MSRMYEELYKKRKEEHKKKHTCQKCGSTVVSIEKQLNGKITCLACFHEWKNGEPFNNGLYGVLGQSDQEKKELDEDLKSLIAVIEVRQKLVENGIIDRLTMSNIKVIENALIEAVRQKKNKGEIPVKDLQVFQYHGMAKSMPQRAKQYLTNKGITFDDDEMVDILEYVEFDVYNRWKKGK